MGEIWGRIRQLCACRERLETRGETPGEFDYTYIHIHIDCAPSPAVAVNNSEGKNAPTFRLGKSTELVDSDPRFAQWSLLSWSQRNLLGRHLITQLDTERRRREHRTPVYICWDHLIDKLRPYDHDFHSLEMRRREMRSSNWFGGTWAPDEETDRVWLMQLASFAPIVKTLASTIDAAMKIIKPVDPSTRNLWHQQLQKERDELMSFFELLLKDNARLMGAIKEDEDAQLEVLTWMKHSFDLHSDALTPRETNVISAIFDRMVQLSGVVLGSLPEWFAISADKWDKAHVSKVTGGEEKCLRTVAIWIELNHPNVRKLFGACHVGKRIFVHERTTDASDTGGMFSWERMLDFAHGLEYLHDRGLVHTDLSINDFHLSMVSEIQGGKGVLSGEKLIRVQDCEKQVLYGFNEDSEAPTHLPIESFLRNQRREQRASDWVASFSTDILSFGGVIGDLLENTRRIRRIKILSPSLAEMQRYTQKTISEILRENPPTQPEFITDDEFKLLLGMHAGASKEIMKTAHVVYQIRVLSQTEASITNSKSDEDGSISDIKFYEFQGEPLPDMLDEAGRLCSSLKELESINRPILERLLEIYSQCIKGPQRKRLIEDFSLILSRFLGSMDDRCFASQAASICASRTIAGKNYSLHHDIDRLLLGDSVLNKTAPVHTWQPRWELCRRQQIARLRECLKNPRAFMGDLGSEGDRRQAIASLAFESRNYGDASLNPTNQAKSDEFNKADVLPKWFIPAHQVELNKHLADGAFGAVYQGRWLDTDVVIKQVLTDQNQDEFRREVDLWFSLNHDYLIKLYGACHEGRAFFVCEQATHGTLVSYANGKPRLKIWECIYEAALGLKYLHERGIVHGDLKGNNILVCEDGVKLADFGLSFIAHHSDTVAGANGALGAYRWKAPECLAGSQPTFASDVYSFGMCIIEVLSGEWPWGKSMPDSAVISNVMEKKLPQQPKTIDSAEWKFVSSMCCFDPDRRISVDVVVSCAFNQCRGLESWRWEYLTQ